MDPSTQFSCLTIGVWLVLAALIVAVFSSAYRATLRWKSRQYLTRTSPTSFGISLYSTLFNPIRRSKGIRPLRVIPFIDESHRNEIDLLERADRLAREVKDALKRSPVSDIRKTSFERQAREVPDNVAKALWHLARLRRLSASIDPQLAADQQNRQDLLDQETKIQAAMTQSVELLAALPVSLIKVEIARSDRAIDRLAADLDESNKRLIDLSAAYAESKQLSM